MKRTSVRVCVVAVFCLMFTVRHSQKVAASPAIAEPGALISYCGFCSAPDGVTLNESCLASPCYFQPGCKSRPSHLCPLGAKVKKLGYKACLPHPPFPKVDAGRPCGFQQ